MRAFRILFACPQTLFDVSNGATMQCYTMLQTLSKLNFQTASIGGGIFDNPSGQARIPNFKEQVSDKSKGEILVNVDSSAIPTILFVITSSLALKAPIGTTSLLKKPASSCFITQSFCEPLSPTLL